MNFVDCVLDLPNALLSHLRERHQFLLVGSRLDFAQFTRRDAQQDTELIVGLANAGLQLRDQGSRLFQDLFGLLQVAFRGRSRDELVGSQLIGVILAHDIQPGKTKAILVGAKLRVAGSHVR